VVEVPSEPEDEKDYVRNVQKYGRYGIDFYMIADSFKKRATLMSEPQASGYGMGHRDPLRSAGRLHSGHRGVREDRHEDLSHT
jgi:hypothetical protein